MSSFNGAENQMKHLILVLLVASFVVLLSAVEQAIEDDESLVLYFPFDEGTGNTVPDKSGYKNDGIIDGAEWVKDGKERYFLPPHRMGRVSVSKIL